MHEEIRLELYVSFKIHWDSARTYSVGNWCLRLKVAIQLYRGISCAGHSAKHGFPAKQGVFEGP